jgi:hypothetical protein
MRIIKPTMSMTREYARMQQGGYPGHARFGAVAIPPANQSGPLLTPNAPDVQFVQDWFIYGLDVLNLAPAGTFNGSIQIQADSDFKMVKLTQASDNAGAAQTESSRILPNASITFLDTGSGRALFSQAIALNALFGTGELPYILPVPRIFKARTNISVTVVSFEAALTLNIRLALHGMKIFQLGG